MNFGPSQGCERSLPPRLSQACIVLPQIYDPSLRAHVRVHPVWVDAEASPARTPRSARLRPVFIRQCANLVTGFVNGKVLSIQSL